MMVIEEEMREKFYNIDCLNKETAMKLVYPFLFVIFIILLGCSPIHTDNPEKAFKYWTHIPLSNSEVEPLKGEYWQSGHITLEYEVYLQIVASKEWRDELIRLNDLSVDTTRRYCPNDAPNWFFPPESFIQYQSPNNSQFRLWIQEHGDTVYIYDQQL